jgi:hypothetical protein
MERQIAVRWRKIILLLVIVAVLLSASVMVMLSKGLNPFDLKIVVFCVIVVITPLLFVAELVSTIIPASRRFRREYRRYYRGECLKCGYDMRGHQVGKVCPECGAEFTGRPPEKP